MHIGAFLNLVESSSTQFAAKFKIGILSSRGNGNTIAAQDERTGEEFKDNFGYGWSQFVDYEELVKDIVVAGGGLTFICEVSSIWDPVERQTENNLFQLSLRTESEESQPAVVTPIENYKKIFENDFLADFELHTNDDLTLKAHKVVIVARSPVFHAMLENEMLEARDSAVTIPDFDSKIIKEILRFMYYNEVEKLDEIAHELVYAAEKYQLEDLKKMCLDKIIASLNTGNVLQSLIVADRVSNTARLFDNCIDLITR